MGIKKIHRNISPQVKFSALILLIIIFSETLILLKPILFKPKIANTSSQKDLIIQVVDSCKNKQGSNDKEKCWDDSLEEILKKNGLDTAYKVYEKLYLEEPVFAENCHGFTHLIGDAAYQKYTRNEDFPVTSGVAYCSYGFFHGFIEAMMLKEGNLDQARNFCDYIQQKLGHETWTTGSCLHGIGHGVTDGYDPRAYGDEHALIDPGLKLCERIGKTDFEIQLCATGVFNALAIMYTNRKYSLTLNKKAPYSFCNQFTKPYIKHACYDDFKTLPFVIESNNFEKAVHYPEAIPEDKYAQDAMDNLSTYAVYFMLKDENLDAAINTCHSVQKRLQVRCITGLGAGLMTSGIPNKEYTRALEFCQSPLLNAEEKDACHERVLGVSFSRYPKQKFNDICNSVELPYRKYCG